MDQTSHILTDQSAPAGLRYSRPAVKDAVTKARSLGRSVILTSVRRTAVLDPLRLYATQAQHGLELKAFWGQPLTNRSFVAGRSIETFSEQGAHLFDRINHRFLDWKERTVLDCPDQDTATLPLFLGGFPFDASGERDDQSSVAEFFVPEWIFLSEDSRGYLCYNLEVKPEQNEEQVERAIDRGFNRVESALLQAYSESDPFATNNHDGQANGNSPIMPDLRDEEQFGRWESRIREITEQVASGEIEKLVLARTRTLTLTRKPRMAGLLRYLREQYETCTTLVYTRSDGSVFISSTPEHILSIRNRNFYTESLAGSTSRSSTAGKDEAYRDALINSSKDQIEHKIVRDDILNQLDQIAENLEFPDQPLVKRLSNVQHLYTPINGTVADNANPFDILTKLHPTPAVGGFPREKVTEKIAMFEAFDRDWYAAPVGWVDIHGNSEFVVAIRSALIRDDKVTIYAGCGIVEESDPRKEWEETNIKFRPMLNAFASA